MTRPSWSVRRRYVERRRQEFALRLGRARDALLVGDASALAHSLGVIEDDVERLGGVASD